MQAHQTCFLCQTFQNLNSIFRPWIQYIVSFGNRMGKMNLNETTEHYPKWKYHENHFQSHTYTYIYMNRTKVFYIFLIYRRTSREKGDLEILFPLVMIPKLVLIMFRAMCTLYTNNIRVIVVMANVNIYINFSILIFSTLVG